MSEEDSAFLVTMNIMPFQTWWSIRGLWYVRCFTCGEFEAVSVDPSHAMGAHIRQGCCTAFVKGDIATVA